MDASEAVREAVRRTTLASGVPELVSDPGTLQDVAALLPSLELHDRQPVAVDV